MEPYSGDIKNSNLQVDGSLGPQSCSASRVSGLDPSTTMFNTTIDTAEARFNCGN